MPTLRHFPTGTDKARGLHPFSSPSAASAMPIVRRKRAMGCSGTNGTPATPRRSCGGCGDAAPDGHARTRHRASAVPKTTKTNQSGAMYPSDKRSNPRPLRKQSKVIVGSTAVTSLERPSFQFEMGSRCEQVAHLFQVHVSIRCTKP